MRSVNLGFITELGNILSKKLEENAEQGKMVLEKMVKEQGWKEFTEGFLNDSNEVNNKKLGGHRVVGEDDEPDGFDKDGYPDKMLVFIGRSKYDNGDVDVMPEPEDTEMIEEELPKMYENENNKDELEEELQEQMEQMEEEDEDDDEKEDEYDQWMEEDKEEKNEELTLNNGNFFSYMGD